MASWTRPRRCSSTAAGSSMKSRALESTSAQLRRGEPAPDRARSSERRFPLDRQPRAAHAAHLDPAPSPRSCSTTRCSTRPARQFHRHHRARGRAAHAPHQPALLDLAKLGAGRLEWHDVGFRSRAGRADARRGGAKASSSRRQITVEADVPGGLPLVRADKDRLTQVVINLLSNAVKFTDPNSGHIWVRARANGDYLEVSVRDNGPGIPHDWQDRIFERFVQLKNRDDPKPQGHGPRPSDLQADHRVLRRPHLGAEPPGPRRHVQLHRAAEPRHHAEVGGGGVSPRRPAFRRTPAFPGISGLSRAFSAISHRHFRTFGSADPGISGHFRAFLAWPRSPSRKTEPGSFAVPSRAGPRCASPCFV